MTATLAIGIALAPTNHPQARWNRIAALLRHLGARQVGGLFEIQANPLVLESWLHIWLDSGDTFVIRVVIPEAYSSGIQLVA